MSLQVWLPLNGDLRNNGVKTDINISAINTLTFVNGKIGQCYQRAVDSTQITTGISIDSNLLDILTDQASVAVWVKPLGTHTHYNGTILSSGNWNAKRWAFGVSQDNSKVDTLCGNHNNYINCSVPVNEWTHLCSTYNNGVSKVYKNGVYIGQLTGQAAFVSDASNTCIGRETYANGYFGFNGLINDMRIYDHCLSDKEIEEIAKGLVLHYKLDTNLNVLDNCFDYPTFNTVDPTGGWGHLGSLDHAGTRSQNTDKQYIYNKTNTYSHCIDNTASAAGKYYGCYQSPTFRGGYRSLQFIIKEANGLPITEAICFPSWNARNGGAPNNKWTKIISLGDGFYLCQVNGLSQDGSNDLVSLQVQSGYKIYISEGYLENYREICSDIFNQDNLSVIHDSSGYGNNGILNDTSAIISSDSARYTVCLKNNQSNNSEIYLLKGNINMPESSALTFSWWMNPTTLGYQISGIFSTSSSDLPVDYNTTAVHMYDSTFACTNASGTCVKITVSPYLITNEWHHYVLTYNGSELNFYVDGISKVTKAQTGALKAFQHIFPFYSKAGGANRTTSGGLSDFRIYVTALSDAQILELYNTSTSIDRNNNVHTRELVEV